MKKLEARLTLLFTALIAVLLLAALCVTYFIAFNQYKAGADRLFNDVFAQIGNMLNEGTISDKWLEKQELASQSVIYIEDNGTPIIFKGAWQPKTPREALVLKAKEEAEKRGTVFSQSSIGQTSNFYINGSSKDKYNTYAQIVKKSGKYIGIILLQDISAINSHGVRLAAAYFAVWACSVLVLFIICRVLTHISVRPAAQAAQRQTEFVAAASHELRSPLAVISASLEAAQKSKAEAQGFLQTAKNESLHMSRLVDDLLLLASGDASAMQVNLQPLLPDSICIELYDKYYQLAKSRGRCLAVALPQETLPMVQGDKARLLQLFAILLENAMEYTAENTPIEIIAEKQGGKVAFKIADHGAGIPESEKDKIFTRFYRADKSRTDKKHFGLGLCVAQQIAKEHGAQLTVCETPGGGATFALQLK